MPHRGIERTDRWKLLSKVRDDTSSTKFILREKKKKRKYRQKHDVSLLLLREVSASRDLSCLDKWWKIRVQALKMGLSFSASRGNTNSPSSCTAAASSFTRDWSRGWKHCLRLTQFSPSLRRSGTFYANSIMIPQALAVNTEQVNVHSLKRFFCVYFSTLPSSFSSLHPHKRVQTIFYCFPREWNGFLVSLTDRPFSRPFGTVVDDYDVLLLLLTHVLSIQSSLWALFNLPIVAV